MSEYVLDLVVREATRADLERMAVLWQESAEVLTHSDPRWRLLPDAVSHWRAAAEKWIVDSEVVVLAAERKGTIVGYLVGNVIDNMPGFAPAQIGNVVELTVDTHGRGDGGIGTQLVKALSQWLAARQITHVVADVPSSSVIAQAFWRASRATVLHQRMLWKVDVE